MQLAELYAPQQSVGLVLMMMRVRPVLVAAAVVVVKAWWRPPSSPRLAVSLPMLLLLSAD